MEPTSTTNGNPHDHGPTPPPPPGPGAKPQATHGGRDRHGRFAEGNAGGPGNPFARQVAALRVALLRAVTEQDLDDVARELVRQAKEGNLAAARLLLSYTLGKPAPAVDPDTLDAQEWEGYRRVPDPGPEAAAMIGRMPLETACEMARVVRPGMAQTWKRMISDGIHQQEREEQQEAERAARRKARRAEKASPNTPPPAAAPKPPADEKALDLLGRLLNLTPPSPNGVGSWLDGPRPASANGKKHRRPGGNGKAP